ncbi:hypothetical protein ACPCSG_23860 [Streptomyces cellulosae]
MSQQQKPQPGDIVRVTYAAVWAPDHGDHRMVLTGNDGADRWHNIVPDNAQIEILQRPDKPVPADHEPGMCPQNRRGDRRLMEPHFYDPGDLRCVFCHQAAPWSVAPARVLRSPDGREWQLAAVRCEPALYEAPFVPRRYTAMELERMYAEQGDLVVVPAPAPPYVLNARSVNQSPDTAVKHIPDGQGHTICPNSYVASAPLPQERAAEHSLCNGCRRVLLARHGDDGRAEA